MISYSYSSLEPYLEIMKQAMMPQVVENVNSLTHIIRSSVTVANAIIRDYADLTAIKNDNFSFT